MSHEKDITRKRFSLDGEWQFRHENGPWRVIRVPGVWQAQFDDLRFHGGSAIYRRRFVISERNQARELALRFEAVNYLAEVYLNGRRLGEHEGGWLPFELPLNLGDLRDENELEIRVTLPSSIPGQLERRPSFAEIPHGKQSWYGPLSGIWQSVWIEERHPIHVVNCRIRAELSGGAVDAEVRLARHESDVTIRATIFSSDGQVHAEAGSSLNLEKESLRLSVDHPALWSMDHPNLYRLELQIFRGRQETDRWVETFGFRTIEARGGRFYLNGQPLYIRGALDQDYYDDLLVIPPSIDLLEQQMRRAKDMGLNCLRCHIKVPDRRYYETADRLGLLIWSEIPNFAQFSESAVERLCTLMEGVLERDGNHPSIIAWTIVNEDWGTDLDEDPDHRAWLMEAYARLKSLDPTRLVVDNSPCFPNFHVRTDINDFHYYRAIPDHRDEWDWITEQFAARPSWAFAPDGVQTGEEPLVVSEFGLWGLPQPKQLKDESGREPWWFETGELFGDGVAYPHGVERRFQLMALERVFGSFDAFIEATQKHQYAGLKYQIEKLREHGPIQGYVITELTDVYWEANGLMDMKRRPRLFAKMLAHLNTDLVVLPRLDRYAYWCGQSFRLSPAVATGGERLEKGGIVRWSIDPGGPKGELPVASAEACMVAATMPLETTAPKLERPGTRELRLTLFDHEERERARNSTEIAFYPQREPERLPSIWTADETIAAFARGLGYSTAPTSALADLIVVRTVGTSDVETIRTGGCYLLLADGTGSDGWLRSDHPVQAAVPTVPAPVNPPFPGIMRRIRRGNVWRGDWITNFGWLARDGAFADIPGGPLLDLSFDRVVPDHVLWGSVRPWEYEAGIMPAGVVVGWVHKPAGFLMQRRFGKGKLVMSTFRLTRDPPGVDPVAAALFDRLVRTSLAR